MQSTVAGRLIGWGPTFHAMSVIPLTIFFSLLLAGLFIALFVHEQRHRRFSSAERDSLLPLADETPHVVGGARAPRGLNLRGAQVPPQAAAAAASDPIYF